MTRFVRDALARGDAVPVAVPAARAGALRQALGPDAWRVSFTDLTRLGRHPARIIPAVAAFADRHAGRLSSYVGEPAAAPA